VTCRESRNFRFSYVIYHRKTATPKAGDIDSLVRHDAAQKMGVWPLEAGLQEWASNHLKLLWSKAMVVSIAEKAHKMRQV
jgi:hypothetical protein